MKRWQILLVVTVVALIGIQLFGPNYNDIQTADNADAVRRIVADDKGRYIAATLCDLVFAAGYGVLGAIAFRKLATGRVAMIGAALIGGGAVADLIENKLVLRNVAGAATTTDGWVDIMRAFGTVKYTLIFASLVWLAGIVIPRAVRPRSG